MATHGRSGAKRWLLGSVAEKVLRGTTNPLFLVRAAVAKASPRRIINSNVVPLDGSSLAEQILPTVSNWAKAFDVEVALIRAFEFPPSAYYGRENYYLMTRSGRRHTRKQPTISKKKKTYSLVKVFGRCRRARYKGVPPAKLSATRRRNRARCSPCQPMVALAYGAGYSAA